MPLGGEWQDLQKVLCGYWISVGQEPDKTEIALLERHFERALAYLEKLPGDESRWLNDLYRLPMAACVIDERGAVLRANDRACDLFASDNHEIELSSSNRQLLTQSIARLKTQDLAASTLRLADNAELRIYLNKMPAVSDQSSQMYLGVFVATNLPDIGLRVLAQQFQLTPREAELCLQMSGGASLEDIARKSDVKKSTLRTHLANCFSKLGVSSQPELVALVLHHMFAVAQLAPSANLPPRLTPYLDPEVHGFPKFVVHTLPDGRSLGYFEYGDEDGIPVIYCHGSFETGMFSKSQRLEGNGVRLIAVERGGVGESSPNPDPSAEAYANDIVSLVDALGWHEYAIIGRSMGSWDAISLALADPQRARLLLFASCKLPIQQESEHDQHLPVYTSIYNAIWHSRTMGRVLLRALRIQLMLRGPQPFLKPDGLPPIEQKLIEDPMFHRLLKANWLRAGCHGVDPIHNHLKLYRDVVENPPWIGLRTPTVLVHGEFDANVPLERILRQTASFVDRKIVVMSEMGHNTVHAALGEILRILCESWRELNADRS